MRGEHAGGRASGAPLLQPIAGRPLSHSHDRRPCSYYIRKSAKPKARLALALAVKVGSAVEEEHEQGVAHVLEHLAFNATKVGLIEV